MDLRAKVHLINFLRKMAVNAVFFLVPLYLLKNGFNGWQIGTAVSLYALTPLLVTFPTGWVNDRLAISGVVRGALAVIALVLAALANTRTFLPTALLFAVFGAANAMLDTSLNSLYYKDRRQTDLNRKFGVYSFWMNFGTAVGTLLGGLLVFLSGFQALFYALAGLMVLTILFVRHFGDEKFEFVSLGEYRRAFVHRKALLLAAMLFVLALHWGLEGTVYSPFLREAFGLNSLQLSIYISGALFATALASYRVSRMRFDQASNQRLFLGGMLMSGAGLALMILPNVYLSFLARVLHETGDGMMAVVIIVFISRLFERRNIGGNAGLLQAIFTLGHVAGAQIFSPMGYSLGLRVPFIVAGAILVLDCAFAYIVFRKLSY